MVKRRLLLTFCLGAWIACADGTGPPGEPGQPPETRDERLHLRELRWKPTKQPRTFEARGDVERSDEVRSAGANGGIASFTVSFWAVAGQGRTIEVEFSDEHGVGQSLLQFTVSNDALDSYPDSTPFADGDSVRITVTLDTEQFLADFEPAGLQFNRQRPAVLQYWYEGADEDLDGDGHVDGDDERIESDLLDMWYQGDDSEVWSRLSATHSIALKQYRLSLEHFSSYAVSW